MKEEELSTNNKQLIEFQQQQGHLPSNYYYKLKKYIPIWYKGKGIPFFLKSRDDPYQSLPCIIFINIVFIMLITLSILNSQQSRDKEFMQSLSIISIIVLIFLNVSYALTVLMNPGIISQEDLKETAQQDLQYCAVCGCKKTMEMSHCIECQVCVEGLDHHCAFFGKCIAGPQKYAFYMFITFIFIGFICILANSSFLLD